MKRNNNQTAKRSVRNKQYELVWRNKWLTAEAKTIDDMIETYVGAACTLRSMKRAGVVLDPKSAIADDYATLVTSDPAVAKELGFDDMAEDDE